MCVGVRERGGVRKDGHVGMMLQPATNTCKHIYIHTHAVVVTDVIPSQRSHHGAVGKDTSGEQQTFLQKLYEGQSLRIAVETLT